MASAFMKVCFTCGVEVVLSKIGKWVHVDSLHKDTPEHDAQPVSRQEYARTESSFVTTRQAAADMLNHHITGHPESDCPFAQQLRAALLR